MDASSTVFAVRDYDLPATLDSGQAFRWQPWAGGWVGVLRSNWVFLKSDNFSITAQSAVPVSDWHWLEEYLQIHLDLASIIRTFPNDEPMQAAARVCRGLRLLRQDPWECLASFILSSTKQIVQIKQIVATLCERFGDPLPAKPTFPRAYSFPSPETVARLSESDLRSCKMGFRAPYLLETSRAIAGGQLDLEALRAAPSEAARERLTQLPGVGRKIADCVLLFAYGFQSAFPVDVWVMKALKQLYFPGRRVQPKRLQTFTQTHFGPNAGYAQQYLFHYMRTAHIGPARSARVPAKKPARPRAASFTKPG